MFPATSGARLLWVKRGRDEGEGKFATGGGAVVQRALLNSLKLFCGRSNGSDCNDRLSAIGVLPAYGDMTDTAES